MCLFTYKQLSLLRIKNKLFPSNINTYKEVPYFFKYLDIDECDPDPCQNGTTCNDQVNGYTCDCYAGYTGTDCQTGNYMTLSFTISDQINCCILFLY